MPRRGRRPNGRSARFRRGARSAVMLKSGASSSATGDVLSVPARALEASADLEPGGVALRGGAAADGRGQAIQEGRERDGGDLEDAAHRGEDVSTPRRARVTCRRRERGRVYQRSTCGEPAREEGRRLISFTHCGGAPKGLLVLTEPLPFR